MKTCSIFLFYHAYLPITIVATFINHIMFQDGNDLLAIYIQKRKLWALNRPLFFPRQLYTQKILISFLRSKLFASFGQWYVSSSLYARLYKSFVALFILRTLPHMSLELSSHQLWYCHHNVYLFFRRSFVVSVLLNRIKTYKCQDFIIVPGHTDV